MASTANSWTCLSAVGRCQITPKMVKDMAAQLGVRPHPDLYWYCMPATELLLAGTPEHTGIEQSARRKVCQVAL